MNVIFIVINVVIAIMSGSAHLSRYLREFTDYYDVSHRKSMLFDTLFDITYRVTTLPVCLICTGLALICAVYGIYKYFDVFFAKKLNRKPLKCIGWFVFSVLGFYNVWGIINIILMHV